MCVFVFIFGFTGSLLLHRGFTNTLMELEHWLLCNKYLSGSELHFSSFYLIGPDEVRTDSVALVSLYSTHWEKSIRENNVPD